MNVSAFENQLPDEAFAGLNAQEESLADGIGSSYGIVGYRGKVWTLRYRGETYTFTRADDGSPAAFLDCIILRSASFKSKSYYPAGSYEQDSGGTRPTCAALDGVTPDADVPNPQSTSCAICPRNEWKVDANGRKGRDCSDYKRLAVLLLPAVSTALLGSALMEPVFLRIPAASLNDLAILGEAMSKKGFHYSTYITRIGFLAEKSHPQMTFKALQKLTKAEAPVVMPMREDPTSYRITGESEVGKPRPVGAASQVTHQPDAAKQTAVQHAAKQAEVTAAARVEALKTTTPPSKEEAKVEAKVEAEDDEEAMLMKQLAAAKAKKAAAAQTAAQAAKVETAKVETAKVEAAKQTVIPPDEKVTTGFNIVEGLGNNQSMVEVASGTTVATANTVEDTGPAEESDTGLDAQVRALMGQ